VSKADRPKTVETDGCVRSNGGDRPVRKRGFYRAFKRCEPWALQQMFMRDLVHRFMNPDKRVK